MQPWFALSILALILFGVTGVTQKLSTNNISFEASFVWFSIAIGLTSAAVPLFVHLDWHIGTGMFVLAALGGLLNGLGVLTSFAAFEKGGKACIVIPIINLYPLVTIGGACLFLGEKLTLLQIVGVLFALAAVVLLSQESAPVA
jgi:transporter family protein